MDFKIHAYSAADLTNYMQKKTRMMQRKQNEVMLVMHFKSCVWHAKQITGRATLSGSWRYVNICKQLNDMENLLYEDGETWA